MDGAYSALGETDIHQRPPTTMYMWLSIPVRESLSRQMNLEYYLQVCPPGSTRDRSFGRRYLVESPYSGLRQLSLNDCSDGRSRSSGGQCAFSWTPFPCTPKSERLAVWGSTGNVHCDGGGGSGLTPRSIKEETWASSIYSWKMHMMTQLDVAIGDDLPPCPALGFLGCLASHLLTSLFSMLLFFYFHICCFSFFPFQPFFLFLFPSVLSLRSSVLLLAVSLTLPSHLVFSLLFYLLSHSCSAYL